MTRLRRTLSLALTAPLALALAACGEQATDPAGVTAAKVAPVPAPAGTAWRDTVVETPEGGHLVGNPDAPIKLVEYGSLTCPTCAAFAEEGMEPLLSKYIDSGRVSFELRNFAVHGPVDIVLARLARCGAKEAVIPLSDQVWKNLQPLLAPLQANQAAVEQALNLPMDQRFNAMAQVGGFYDFFAARGISADQARTCLADVPSLEALAAATDRYARQDGVTGTPTFTLNGQKLEGVNGWAQLEPALQRAGAR
jgi:protein-disulfide isomerase